ncbi:hypothetical protein G6011_07580 [Alternaria panax]|uniref:Uncharacterized protein n=1 Tax=Alternaria panax TaxID=48097 RepID=A0AAD4FF19_9PLEO|nr:hypothetical protein G6011_07580 [Alternaria panax]
MVHEHELLVHISTPATRQNDQLYRSLVDAYLDFEPVQVHGKRSEQSHDEDPSYYQQHDVSSQSATTRMIDSDPAPPNQASSFCENVNTSMLLTSKDSFGSFPSGALLSDSDDVAAPPPPPSSRLAQLEHTHQNWKVQAATIPTSSGISKQRSISGGSSGDEDGEDVDTAFIEDTQEARLALQSQMLDSFEMGYEDTEEEEVDEETVRSNDDAGIFTQEVALAGVEIAEPGERTVGAEAEALPGELGDSSLISWEDSDDMDVDAGHGAQEVAPSFDKSAEHTIATTAEEPATPRAETSFKAPIPAAIPLKSSGELKPKADRRKSARLEKARAAEAKASDPLALVPSARHSESSNTAPGKRKSSRLNDASKLAAPFKIPTTVANRRKSARLEGASTTEAKAHIPSNRRLNSRSTGLGQQEALRLDASSKPAVSMVQHKISETDNVHESDKLDQPVDFSAFPHSVLAPEPQIGTSTPSTWPSQLTPYLTSLATKHPTLFQPLQRLHTPNPDTRGWWSVDCSSWPG